MCLSLFLSLSWYGHLARSVARPSNSFNGSKFVGNNLKCSFVATFTGCLWSCYQLPAPPPPLSLSIRVKKTEKVRKGEREREWQEMNSPSNSRKRNAMAIGIVCEKWWGKKTQRMECDRWDERGVPWTVWTERASSGCVISCKVLNESKLISKGSKAQTEKRKRSKRGTRKQRNSSFNNL